MVRFTVMCPASPAGLAPCCVLTIPDARSATAKTAPLTIGAQTTASGAVVGAEVAPRGTAKWQRLSANRGRPRLERMTTEEYVSRLSVG